MICLQTKVFIGLAASLLMHSPGGARSIRVRKNWRDIFFVFTRRGFLDVATPVLGWIGILGLKWKTWVSPFIRSSECSHFKGDQKASKEAQICQKWMPDFWHLQNKLLSFQDQPIYSHETMPNETFKISIILLWGNMLFAISSHLSVIIFWKDFRIDTVFQKFF